MRILFRTFLPLAMLASAVSGAFAQCACGGWPDPFVRKPEAERTEMWTHIISETGQMLKVWEDELAAGKNSEAVVGAAEDTQSSWSAVSACFAYRPPSGYAKDDSWFDETTKATASFGEARRATRDKRPAADVLALLHEARSCVARLREANKLATMGDAVELLLPLLNGIEQQTVPDYLRAYAQAFKKHLVILQAAPVPATAKGEPVHYAQARAAAVTALERLQTVIDAGDTAQVKAVVRDTRKALGSLYDRYGRDLI